MVRLSQNHWGLQSSCNIILFMSKNHYLHNCKKKVQVQLIKQIYEIFTLLNLRAIHLRSKPTAEPILHVIPQSSRFH